jgi:hypothetical protein
MPLIGALHGVSAQAQTLPGNPLTTCVIFVAKGSVK